MFNMALPTVVSLNEFQSSSYFELETRTSGTYIQLSEIRGNSILSSIYVESITPGSTIKVNYFDTTTGANLGERFDLLSHDLVDDTSTNQTFRILVGRIHRRVVCEVIVVGSASFSVYATAITSSASEIDSALIRDGEDYTDPEDQAMPMAYLDETTDQLFFVRGINGAIKVTGTVTALSGGKSIPKSTRFNLALAATEYEYTFSTNTISFWINNENTNATIKASWQSGETATNYFSIKPGQTYSEEGIIATTIKIYVQSSKPNIDLSIIEWT